MKGRNCYTCLWSHPGLEKLFNFIEVKASFLRPVSLSLSQREPFSPRAAAVNLPDSYHALGHFNAAAVFSFALFSRVRSQHKFHHHKQFLRQGSGCDSSFCRTYCSRRSVWLLGFNRKVCPQHTHLVPSFPTVVFSNALHILRGGLQSLQRSFLSFVVLAARRREIP
ncbi:hypothetical protein ES707_20657 [subsurface metagenome]